MSHSPLIEIRAAKASDAAPVRDLVRAAYAKWVPLIGREPAPMKADYERAIREHDIDILFLDGGMAGLIEMAMQPDHLWIENVAISPGHQGKGLGRHLMAHAEGKAAAVGRAELRLLTNGAFAVNIALYQAIGYVVDRTEPFLNGTTVYMSKRCA